MIDEVRTVEKIYIAGVLLLPILHLYKFAGSFSFADITIVFLVSLVFINNKFVICFTHNTRKLRVYILWLVISWIIGSVIITAYGISQNMFANSLFSALRVCLYYIASVVLSHEIRENSWDYLMKLYKYMVAVTTIVLLGQFIVHMFTGRILLGYFQFLPLMNTNVDAESLIRLNTYAVYRPYSVFTEPGMYVRYVIPYVILVMFKKENAERLLPLQLVGLGVIVIACLLSGSGQGFAVLCLIFIVYFVNFVRKGKIPKRWIFVFVMLIAAAIYYSTTENFYQIIVRLDPNNAGTNFSSFGIRIFRGFIVYSMLPIASQIVGIGFGNQDAVLNTLNISTQFDQANNLGYMNSAAYTLVNAGVIGFVLFMWVFIRIIINKGTCLTAKVFSIVLIALSFIGGTTTSVMGIMFFTLMFAIDTKCKKDGGWI